MAQDADSPRKRKHQCVDQRGLEYCVAELCGGDGIRQEAICCLLFSWHAAHVAFGTVRTHRHPLQIQGSGNSGRLSTCQRSDVGISKHGASCLSLASIEYTMLPSTSTDTDISVLSPPSARPSSACVRVRKRSSVHMSDLPRLLLHYQRRVYKLNMNALTGTTAGPSATSPTR